MVFMSSNSKDNEDKIEKEQALMFIEEYNWHKEKGYRIHADEMSDWDDFYITEEAFEDYIEKVEEFYINYDTEEVIEDIWDVVSKIEEDEVISFDKWKEDNTDGKQKELF